MTRIFQLFKSDAALVKRLARGDDDVLAVLFETNIRMISRYVLNNRGTEADAKELLQDALVILWEKVNKGEFDLQSKLSTYLYAVVKNKWLRELERRKRYTGIENLKNNPAPERDAAVQLQADELAEIVRRCMDRLQPLCRRILTMFYYEERSMKEIKEATGLANENVVKSKKYQCKKELERLVKLAMV